MPIIIQKGSNTQRSQTLVLGTGLNLGQTADGLPEVSAPPPVGEAVVEPSGGDDTAAIQNKMWSYARVRLAPGTFNVSAIIDIPAGVLVTGSGMDKTTIVKSDYAGAVFRLGNDTQYAGVENLRIRGPGKGIATGNQAIAASRSSTGLAIARRLSFRNLYIEEIGEFGIYLSACAQVEIQNVAMDRIGYHGVYIKNGGLAHLSSVRISGSGNSIVVRGASGVSLQACEVEGSYGSFFIDAASDVVLNACVSRKCENVPLQITGGANVVVNGFVSDNRGAAYFVDKPHLLVDGLAAGVQINGFHRFNTDQLGTLTAEANVTNAGGPVLVGAHDFDRGKVISGGKFAEIDSTALA